MKKLLNLFILPALSGMVIIYGLHTVLPHTHIFMLQQSTTDQLAGYLGFFFGFLPCFLFSYAKYSLSSLRAEYQTEQANNEPLQPVYVGQVFTSVGSNCRLRVKSVNYRNVLEYNNPLLLDYL